MANPAQAFSKALAFCMCLIFAGCQSLFVPKHTVAACQPPSCIGFNISGKIGVKSSQQAGSALYQWVQNTDTYRIELSGILGIGRTLIVGDKTRALLTNASGQWQDSSANNLLYKVTGWHAPIESLPYWLMAKPSANSIITKTNTRQLPVQLTEQSWLVDLFYQENSDLPYKLIMVNKAERVTMTINQR